MPDIGASCGALSGQNMPDIGKEVEANLPSSLKLPAKNRFATVLPSSPSLCLFPFPGNASTRSGLFVGADVIAFS